LDDKKKLISKFKKFVRKILCSSSLIFLLWPTYLPIWFAYQEKNQELTRGMCLKNVNYLNTVIKRTKLTKI